MTAAVQTIEAKCPHCQATNVITRFGDYSCHACGLAFTAMAQRRKSRWKLVAAIIFITAVVASSWRPISSELKRRDAARQTAAARGAIRPRINQLIVAMSDGSTLAEFQRLNRDLKASIKDHSTTLTSGDRANLDMVELWTKAAEWTWTFNNRYPASPFESTNHMAFALLSPEQQRATVKSALEHSSFRKGDFDVHLATRYPLSKASSELQAIVDGWTGPTPVD